MVTRSFVQKILFIFLFSSVGSVLSAKPVNTKQVRKVAETFLEARNVRQGERPKVLSMMSSEGGPGEKYAIADVKEIHGDNGEVLAYVIELRPEGYIITAADDDIRPILGYSFKGRFPFEEAPQNVLLHLVQWDVEARLKSINQLSLETTSTVQANNKQWDGYLVGDEDLVRILSEATQWPDPYWCPACGYRQANPGLCEICSTPVEEKDGWITTNWHQNSHFNDRCPLLQPGGIGRCAVGCVATAMGQIINYWEYPSSVQFNSLPWPFGDAYTSSGDAGNVQIDGDAIARDFPTFSELNTALSTIDYNQDPTEEAYLCFAAGIKVGMRYGSNSAAGLCDHAYRNDFSYGSAIGAASPAGLWSSYESRVIENIQKEWPVQIGIAQSGAIGGHFVIVDGYKTTGDLHFHVNYGAGGALDMWYNPSVINNFDLVNGIIYDICPYQGWNQWGADEKNSFRTPYIAPTTNPPVDKWQVTSRSGWRMRGLVVGTGNKIYAACSWAHIGFAKPYILEIDQYGVVENEIEIPKEGNAGYPVQSKNGEIFVAVSPPIDPGRIYKIEPWTDNPTPTLYFSEPQGVGLSTLKVDPKGWLYAYSLNNLYCIVSSGNLNWTFSAPGGSWFFGPPAIDVERNLVYISSYNISTDTAYLACLNRNTGALACAQKVFPNVTKDIGIPLIGPDGRVYVRCEYTLYAFNAFPETFTLLEYWQMPTGASFHHAIAADGTIYTSYWKSDPNCLVLAAINSANRNVNWETPLPLQPAGPNEYINVEDLYAASNKVIVFFVHKQVLHDDDIEPWAESSYILYAYRDNGDSYEYLWEKDFGTIGGRLAFGPSATIYVIPSTLGDENTLYAISEGARGDPDGGGMGYTDNAAPLIPSNPGPPDEAQDVNSTVTLSWTCDDPEGHARKYSVFVGKAGYDMVPVAKDISETSFSLEGLRAGRSYAWKVTATDGQAVTEGPTWIFETKQPDPDLHKDGFVDFLDFSKLARHWLETCSGPGWCDGVDLDWSEKVALPDLQIIAEAWLEGIK